MRALIAPTVLLGPHARPARIGQIEEGNFSAGQWAWGSHPKSVHDKLVEVGDRLLRQPLEAQAVDVTPVITRRARPVR